MEGEPLVKAIEAIEGFKPFATEATGEAQIHLAWTEETAPDFTTKLYQTEQELTKNCFGRYEKGYLFATRYHAYDDHPLQIWVPQGANKACVHGNLDHNLLRFACWIAFGILIAPHKAVAIHTSAIVFRDKAVLFLGESGTGKSTHTRLWREHIPGAELLNDDSPIVRIVQTADADPICGAVQNPANAPAAAAEIPDASAATTGAPVKPQAMVFGAPWSGKTPCYRNVCQPIRAIVRLSQAPHNRIRRLRAIEAIGALLPSCPPSFAHDETLEDAVCATVSAVVAQVPVYHLECRPDAAAAELACRTIFGGESANPRP